jgi:glycosyltransferase involved in cell wall biosynthesis
MQQCYCNLSYFTIPHANLTMVEAGIECLPTIAAKNEESLDYSFGGKYACLFNPSDIEDFCEAIKTLDKQYEQCKSLLKTGAPILAKRFSRQENVKRLNTIIDKF